MEENTKLPKGFFSFENIRSLGLLILFILAFRWSVMSPYVVPTASMESTIKVGDRLLANKLAYELRIPFTNVALLRWADVQRGDIIVFSYPNDPAIDFVKRVVGVAGDRIQIKNDILILNSVPQVQDDFNADRSSLDDIFEDKDKKMLFREMLDGHYHWILQQKSAASGLGDWPHDGREYVVPENSVFVVGDNRRNSSDSRSWGEVPLSYVQGKAVLVLWSAYKKPELSSWYRFRWSRMGHFLDSDVPRKS